MSTESLLIDPMRQYIFQITGISPLLMHNDDVEWADQMEAWKLDPANKKYSKAGDDRTPAHRWIGCLYHDGDHICMPGDLLSRSMTLAAAGVLVPGGRSGKSFKEQSQSGIQFEATNLTFKSRGQQIPMEPIEALQLEPQFSRHKALVRSLGFDLSVKRARVGQNKHIRVRPIFDNWTVEGVVGVTDDQITTEILSTIMRLAGQRKGLGDWRPSSKTPGPYGRFTVELEEA